ncbi:MAG TPA: DUF4337 domain-containing protein [Nitrospirota bacterium]|nr:DUF4337 domain-containing protein [Nitrospirota bacterium]
MEPKEFQEISEKVHEAHAKRNTYEIMVGLLMALFAASLGINDIGDKKAEAKYIVANNEKANAYQWYQAKSIKQNIAEGQKDMLGVLVNSGVIKGDSQKAINKVISQLESNVAKYEKEKAEILGRKQEHPEAQERAVKTDSQNTGKNEDIISAFEWEKRAHSYHKMGNDFALATLFLQLCLVLGAVSLMIHEASIRKTLLVIFLSSGVAGIVFSVIAYVQFFALLQ